jgi:UDP-glucose 4-epimerase
MSDPQKKILVTGASGYIAGAFLRALVARGWPGPIVGLDKVPARSPVEGVDYLQADMLAPEWRQRIEEQKPDVLVHLAFVLNPMHDEALMHRINVEGTEKTFAAALAAGVKQLVVASSATAYGAFPDNPLPLREDHPIRAAELPYAYARDKGILEFFYERFRRENPTCAVAVIRPVIVFGPGVDNYLSRLIYAFPIVPLPNGGNTPMQLVHEEDVAGVLVRIVETGKSGAFNVAGDGWLTFAKICQMAKRPTLSVPEAWLRVALKALWKTGWRRIEAPETLVDYMINPWVVSTDRVTEELGYRMRFSSRDAAWDMIRRHA